MNPLNETQQRKLQQERRFMYDTLCKNAELEEKIEYSKELGEYEASVLNNGCQNNRRHGSSWCQDCSDDFKKKTR